MKQKRTLSPLIRIFLIILFIIVAIFGLARIYYRSTDDFRIGNMQHKIPYHPEWNIPSLNPEQQQNVDAILSQQFSYIGKGAQSYVFESADHQYVIKFFKFKHLKPFWLTSLLPNVYPFKEYKEQVAARKNRKLLALFNGYRLGYEVNSKESGLVFMQLNPTHIHKEVVLKDKLGLERHVDLGSVIYVIQEKGVVLKHVLGALLDQGNVALTKQRIGQIFDLYLSEYRKGIYDHDHGVMHNTGFIGDRPLHLDIGKLTKDENIKDPKAYHEDISKVASKIIRWVSENYPQYAEEIIASINTHLAEIK